MKYSLFFYVRSLSMNIYSVHLDIFLYIIIYYRLIIYLLNYFIYFYMARMSYYRKIVYKFKYFKSQGFGIQDYYFLLIVQLIIMDFIFSKCNIFILPFSCLNCFYYVCYLGVVLIFILYQFVDFHIPLINFLFISVKLYI